MANDTVQGMFEGFESYNMIGVKVTDQVLGTGMHSTLLRVDYMGLKCAGKKIHMALLGQQQDISYMVQRFRDECEILSRLRHPNIIQFLGVHFQQEEHVPILIMEFLPLNLTQCLSKYSLQQEISYSILYDVALGLHYLHSQSSPIVHRDLSSNNILLTLNMTAKISDLGVARILDLSPQEICMTQVPGTPAFMPPEVMVAKPKYDTSVDVFSYGIMMIHVLSGKWPEPQIGPSCTKDGRLIPVSEAERREQHLIAIGYDHPLMNLVRKCIENDPPMRAHSSEIANQLEIMVKKHPAFINQLSMLDYIISNKETPPDFRHINKHEDNQKEMKGLVDKIERAIDSLKYSLMEEVRRMMFLKSPSSRVQEATYVDGKEKAATVRIKRPTDPSQHHYESIPDSPRSPNNVAVTPKHVKSVSDIVPHTRSSTDKLHTQEDEVDAKRHFITTPPSESADIAPQPRWLSEMLADTQTGSNPRGLKAQPYAVPVLTKSEVAIHDIESDMNPVLAVKKQDNKLTNYSRPQSESTDGVPEVTLIDADQHPPLVSPQRTERNPSVITMESSALAKQGLKQKPQVPPKPKCISDETATQRKLRSSSLFVLSRKQNPQDEMTKGKLRSHSTSDAEANTETDASHQKERFQSLMFQKQGKYLTIQERYDLVETTKAEAPGNSVEDRKEPDQQIQGDSGCSTSELTFKRGDQVYIKNKEEGEMVEGTIPKSHVPPLENEEWFFGELDFRNAKKLVMTSSHEVGSFLVHETKETGKYCLTVRSKSKVILYPISNKDGKHYVSQQCSFGSIHDVIEHHTQMKDGLFTKLTHPCVAPHCTYIKDLDEIHFKDKLVSTNSSEVWKGQCKQNPVLVYKIKQGTIALVDLLQSCAFMTSLKHENLIQFQAIYMVSEPFLVVTEQTANGSLNQYLPNERRNVKISALMNISAQVATAMSYLEERNCIHDCLAAKNIMITVCQNQGASIICKLTTYPHVHKLTEPDRVYIPPSGTIHIRRSSLEAIINKQISTKSNVWSFGILLWEIIHYCERYPYPEMSDIRVLEELKRGYRMRRPLGCPEELYGLISDCWNKDVGSRPTFKMLYSILHEFSVSEDFGYKQIRHP